VRARRWLPFLPSLLFGAAGVAWMILAPPDLPARKDPLAILLVAALAAAGLLTGARVLESTVPSFRWASRTLERALRGLELPHWAALLLAAATAAGEELFFRGGLMQPLGVWGQALVFGALHPVPPRGWAYSAYAVLAGVVFGYATLLTGSLWTAALAHFAVNLHGLWTAKRRDARGQRSGGAA
jgi:membrane protease YdiL (CAAX protease family)